MQKERGNKYKVELAYICDSESQSLPHEGVLLIAESGKNRKYGAASIRVNAATDDILREQMQTVMRALDGQCDIQIVDSRRK